MGLSSKKSSSTSTTNSSSNSNFNSATSGFNNSQTTATNPAFVAPALEGVTNAVTNLANVDPTSFVAGPDALQTQAGQGAAGLSVSPYFDSGANLIASGGQAPANMYSPNTGTAASSADYISQFMNPYVNDVVNTSLAGFDQNAAQQTQQAGLGLNNDATFGGSGGALQLGQLGGQLALSRGQLSSGLYSDAYNNALQAANAQADRAQNMTMANTSATNTASQYDAGARDAAANRQIAAGQALTATGAAAGNQANQNIATQASIGSILQAIQQAKAGAPLALTSAQASLLGSLAPALNLLHGSVTNDVNGSTTSGDSSTTGTSTTTGSTKQSGATLSDWLNYLSSGAKAAAAGG